MDSPLPPPPVVRWGIPGLIVLLVFVAFWPALDFGFVNWDDPTNFRDNPHYRGLGTDQLRWMWTNTMGHYMPLTWMTLGLDYELWGMDARGYHLTSTVLQAVNAVLLYVLLLNLLGRIGGKSSPSLLRLAAGVGTLFWAVHPLRAESVAWVTERRDLVCGFFALLSLIAYVRAVPEDGSSPRYVRFVPSILLFGASLLGKTISLPLPLALIVLDVYPLGRLRPGPDGRLPWRRLLAEKIPFFGLTVAAVGLTLLTTEEAGAFGRQDLLSHLMNPGYRLTFYLSKEVLPIGLGPLYPYRPFQSLRDVHYLAGNAAALAVVGLSLRYARRFPPAAAALIAFGAFLGPFLGLVQAGGHFAADRYTYLASVPLALLAADLALRAGLRRPGWTMPAAAGAAALLLIGLTLRQTTIWSDSEALWTRAIEIDPSAVAHNNRGSHRAALGRHAQALEDFAAASRLEPANPRPVANQVEPLLRLGRRAEAEAAAEHAIRIDPGYARGWKARGSLRLTTGDLAGAEADLTRALELDRVLLAAYIDRAVARGMLGNLDGAIADCTLAVMIHPYYKDAYLNRAVARIEKGDVQGGIDDYQIAVALDPSVPDAWAGRGIAYGLLNRWAEAAADFRKALDIAQGTSWPRRADTERRLQDALRRSR